MGSSNDPAGRLREIDHGCLTTSPDLPLPSACSRSTPS
jgi:hypothetical protein